MPAAHGLMDLDDLNSLYQDLLDRYTSGADVPFREVQKVWRNTTQPPCGLSGFYEQLVPLVRAINRNSPRDKALRILAGDPPFDWDQIKTVEDLHKAVLSFRRDTSIASVLEREAYLGSPDLRLWEKVPADIALDSDYMKERRRRSALPGSPAAAAVQPADGLDGQIFDRAENPLFRISASPATAADIEQAVRDCRERKLQPPPK